jgi:adenine C2-methylase RlmN of 23S rRNA A2503 and tRNA A37
MSITPEIQALVERLNQELDKIEQESIEGENLLQQLMSVFSNNVSLIQFFAYFQTTRFFVVNARRRIDEIIDKLIVQEIDTQIVAEAGEDLAALLGEIIETSIKSRNLLNRLRNLS